MKNKPDVEWQKMPKPLVESFLTQIDRFNYSVECYTYICNAFRPILEKYQEYFKSVDINWTQITCNLKDDCNIPPLYCECDQAGLAAIYKESKHTFVGASRYADEYKDIVTRQLVVGLK